MYTQEDVMKLVVIREGETKLGQKANTLSSLEELSDYEGAFVLVGIPEDIGIRANHGVAGASTTWLPTLKAILNTQDNQFSKGNLVVLGHFDFEDPKETDVTSLRKKVEEIDAWVAELIFKIMESNNTPIVIGGGHNNAYPIIKGCSAALNKAIEVINIDAHADLRPTDEGRHSGNGFSYAMSHNYLKKYGVFGLHQNYNNQIILDEINRNDQIHPVFFENLLLSKKPLVKTWLKFVDGFQWPGLEIDLDAIANVLCSAATPSGFTVDDVRKMILASERNTFSYLHICEGAFQMIDGRRNEYLPKIISHLVIDFIKSQY